MTNVALSERFLCATLFPFVRCVRAPFSCR